MHESDSPCVQRRKAKKQERKEQQKERRERISEAADRAGGDDDNAKVDSSSPYDSTIEVRQHVWYDISRDGTRKRGLVKAVHEATWNCVIEPETNPDLVNSYEHWSLNSVFKDWGHWTLRFGRRESVLVKDKVAGWLPAVVLHEWPVTEERTRAACYACFLASRAHDDTMHLVLEDTDSWIIKHPDSFRISVGDEVTFASKLAPGLQASDAQ